jgi:hypothetical protein
MALIKNGLANWRSDNRSNLLASKVLTNREIGKMRRAHPLLERGFFMSLFNSLISYLEQNGASLVLEQGIAVLVGQKQDWRVRLFVRTHNANIASALRGQVWIAGYRVVFNSDNHIIHIGNNPYGALHFMNKLGYGGCLVKPNETIVTNWKTGFKILISPPSFAGAVSFYRTPTPDEWFRTLLAPNGTEERFGYHDVMTTWRLIMYESYEPVETFNY